MKITGGKYNSLTIKTADYTNIKPTLSKIRQAVFNTVNSLGEYRTFCDLFAGSGIMTFEALSRDFEVHSVEIDKKSTKIILENAFKLNIPLNLTNTDSIKFLKKTELKFDIFYIDPPYKSGLYNSVLEIIASRNILNNKGVIIIEKPQALDINTQGFQIIKEKIYSGKSIRFLQLSDKLN